MKNIVQNIISNSKNIAKTKNPQKINFQILKFEEMKNSFKNHEKSKNLFTKLLRNKKLFELQFYNLKNAKKRKNFIKNIYIWLLNCKMAENFSKCHFTVKKMVKYL